MTFHYESKPYTPALPGCLGLKVAGGFFILIAMLTPASAAHQPAKASTVKTTQIGLASYYGKGFQGKKTAHGEMFDKNDMTAAHPTYPLGTRLRVTNLRNQRSIMVRVNDRGPAPQQRSRGVIIDLSEGAAAQLGFQHRGRTRVKTEILEWGKPAAGATTAVSSPASARFADARRNQPQIAESD